MKITIDKEMFMSGVRDEIQRRIYKKNLRQTEDNAIEAAHLTDRFLERSRLLENIEDILEKSAR